MGTMVRGFQASGTDQYAGGGRGYFHCDRLSVVSETGSAVVGFNREVLFFILRRLFLHSRNKRLFL